MYIESKTHSSASRAQSLLPSLVSALARPLNLLLESCLPCTLLGSARSLLLRPHPLRLRHGTPHPAIYMQ
jgi:hypothetical protein